MKIEKTSNIAAFDSLEFGAVFEDNGMFYQKLSRTLYFKGNFDSDEYTEVNAVTCGSGIPSFFKSGYKVIEHPNAKLII